MKLHQPSGHRALGYSLAALTAVLWGALPLALHIVVQVLDPVTITWFRFGLCGLVLVPILALRGGLPRLRSLPRAALGVLVAATLGLAGNYVFYLTGLARTSAANAQMFVSMAPLLLAGAGMVIFRERFTRAQWTGAVVLVAGLLAFFASQLESPRGGVAAYVLGAAFVVVSAVSWAVYGVAQKQALRWLGSGQVMLCVYAGCFVLLSPGIDLPALAAVPRIELLVLLLCALNTLLGYGAFAAALEHIEASRVSAVLATMPIITLVLALVCAPLLPAWVVAEQVTALTLVGAGAVVAGALAVSLGGRRSGS